MPRSALVHIGIVKTGTTSVYAALHALARAGRLPGIGLPRPGRFSQSFLVAAYRPSDRLPRSMGPTFHGAPDEVRRSLRAAWRTALRDSAGSIVVLCEFLSFLSDAEVAALRQDLAEAGFEDIRCIVYLRDPAALYLSVVQQSLKASAAVLQPGGFQPGYRQLVGRWRSLFDSRISLRLFDPAHLVGGDAVADFMAALSAVVGADLPESPPRQENRSLSVEGMICMQAYRRHVHPGADDRFAADSTRLAELIPEAERGVSRALTKPRLRPGVEALVRAGADDDVAFLRETFGDAVAGSPAQNAPAGGPFADIADLLEPHDPGALEELQARLLAALLRPPAAAAEGR